MKTTFRYVSKILLIVFAFQSTIPTTLFADFSFNERQNKIMPTSHFLDLKSGAHSESSATPVDLSQVTPPLVVGGQMETEEDTLKNFELGPKQDAAGRNFIYTLLQDPSHGQVVIEGNVARYTPALNFSGEDTFDYRGATKEGEKSEKASVAITIASTNDAPTTKAPSHIQLLQDTSSQGIKLGGLDADGDPLNIIITSMPAHGALVEQSDKTYIYTPEKNFFGQDTLSYKVSDGSLSSPETSVQLDVKPVALLSEPSIIEVLPPVSFNKSYYPSNSTNPLIKVNVANNVATIVYMNQTYTGTYDVNTNKINFSVSKSDGTQTWSLEFDPTGNAFRLLNFTIHTIYTAPGASPFTLTYRFNEAGYVSDKTEIIEGRRIDKHYTYTSPGSGKLREVSTTTVYTSELETSTQHISSVVTVRKFDVYDTLGRITSSVWTSDTQKTSWPLGQPSNTTVTHAVDCGYSIKDYSALSMISGEINKGAGAKYLALLSAIQSGADLSLLRDSALMDMETISFYANDDFDQRVYSIEYVRSGSAFVARKVDYANSDTIRLVVGTPDIPDPIDDIVIPRTQSINTAAGTYSVYFGSYKMGTPSTEKGYGLVFLKRNQNQVVVESIIVDYPASSVISLGGVSYNILVDDQGLLTVVLAENIEATRTTMISETDLRNVFTTNGLNALTTLIGELTAFLNSIQNDPDSQRPDMIALVTQLIALGNQLLSDANNSKAVAQSFLTKLSDHRADILGATTLEQLQALLFPTKDSNPPDPLSAVDFPGDLDAQIAAIRAQLAARLVDFENAKRALDPGEFLGNMPSDRYIHNIADPNFSVGKNIIQTTSDGNWSDLMTQLNLTPEQLANTILVIRHNIVLNQSARVFGIALYPGGKLIFKTDANIILETADIQVNYGASLIVGTEDQPITGHAEIVFRDIALNSQDHAQYGRGLFSLGEVKMHGRALSQSFMRLGAEPLRGATSITLESPISGWRVGDRITIPDTRQGITGFDLNIVGNQNESVVITAISADGKTIFFGSPLLYDHKGARDANGHLDFLGHVMNETRNVVLRSENPEGVRGHTMFSEHADVDIRYATFRNLGRTLAEALDNTTFDAQGNPTHLGTNQAGRYAMHFHHLYGDPEIPENGYQFTAIGNSFVNDTASDPHKWSLTVHGSHYGLIQDNVVKNVAGAGIVSEDGSESFNMFRGNFVMQVSSRAQFGTNEIEGLWGAGFWFRGFNNYVRDNVSTNTGLSGFSYMAYRLGNVIIPKFQGAMPGHNPEDGLTIPMGEIPILDFSGNEAYGMIDTGFDIWELGGNGETLYEPGQSVIKDLKLWNFSRDGIKTYRTSVLLFDNVMMRGDIDLIAHKSGNYRANGFSFGQAYITRDIYIRNCDIQGLFSGIDQIPIFMVPANIVALSGGRSYNNFNVTSAELRAILGENNPGLFIIENTKLVNHINLMIDNVSVDFPERRVIIRNVDFGHPAKANTKVPAEHIRLQYARQNGFINNLRGLDQIFVSNSRFDGIAIPHDIQLYYKQQHPDFIMPRTGSRLKLEGSPVDGLTNRQNWDQYGIAIGGALAPCQDGTGPNTCVGSDPSRLLRTIPGIGTAWIFDVTIPALVMTTVLTKSIIDVQKASLVGNAINLEFSVRDKSQLTALGANHIHCSYTATLKSGETVQGDIKMIFPDAGQDISSVNSVSIPISTKLTQDLSQIASLQATVWYVNSSHKDIEELKKTSAKVI